MTIDELITALQRTREAGISNLQVMLEREGYGNAARDVLEEVIRPVTMNDVAFGSALESAVGRSAVLVLRAVPGRSGMPGLPPTLLHGPKPGAIMIKGARSIDSENERMREDGSTFRPGS